MHSESVMALEIIKKKENVIKIVIPLGHKLVGTSGKNVVSIN